MIFSFFFATVLLVLTLGLLWLLKYSYSIHRAVLKYAHIPGPTPTGIKGFFFGDMVAIIQQDNKGVSMQQYLASL
jgi:hypothetical protein